MLWLVTFTVNSKTSPSRTKRGGFGCTINSLAVTISASNLPERNSRSCARARNRQRVNASGIVKLIRTTPLLSACNCGKKNADSFKFARADICCKFGVGTRPGGEGTGKAAFIGFAASPDMVMPSADRSLRVRAAGIVGAAITAPTIGAGGANASIGMAAPLAIRVTPSAAPPKPRPKNRDVPTASSAGNSR